VLFLIPDSFCCHSHGRSGRLRGPEAIVNTLSPVYWQRLLLICRMASKTLPCFIHRLRLARAPDFIRKCVFYKYAALGLSRLRELEIRSYAHQHPFHATKRTTFRNLQAIIATKLPSLIKLTCNWTLLAKHPAESLQPDDDMTSSYPTIKHLKLTGEEGPKLCLDILNLPKLETLKCSGQAVANYIIRGFDIFDVNTLRLWFWYSEYLTPVEQKLKNHTHTRHLCIRMPQLITTVATLLCKVRVISTPPSPKKSLIYAFY
jgi:hypothetical protein